MSSVSWVRIALAIALFASVVFAPWWLSLTLSVVLTARWKAWEVVLAGVLYDLLWLPAAAGLESVTLPFATIITIILVFMFEPLRRQLLL